MKVAAAIGAVIAVFHALGAAMYATLKKREDNVHQRAQNGETFYIKLGEKDSNITE